MFIEDRIKETCTVSGTGDVTLTGAVPSFFPFSGAYNNTQCYYVLYDPVTNDVEIGLGTYNTSTNTITRNTVYRSTNSNNKVAFTGAAPKYIYNDVPSQMFSQTGAVNKVPIGNVSNKLDPSWLPASGTGSGNVTGPNPSTTDAIAAYLDETGEELRDTSVIIHSNANDKLEYSASFQTPVTDSNISLFTCDMDLSDKFYFTVNQDTHITFTNESVGQRVTIYLTAEAAQNPPIRLSWYHQIAWHNFNTPTFPQYVNGYGNMLAVTLECVGFDIYDNPIFAEISRRQTLVAETIWVREIGAIDSSGPNIDNSDDIVYVPSGNTDFSMFLDEPLNYFDIRGTGSTGRQLSKRVSIFNQSDGLCTVNQGTKNSGIAPFAHNATHRDFDNNFSTNAGGGSPDVVITGVWPGGVSTRGLLGFTLNKASTTLTTKIILTLVGEGVGVLPQTINIRAIDAANPTFPVNGAAANALYGGGLTTQNVSLVVNDANKNYYVDVTTIVQHIISLGGWTSGNEIIFVISGTVGSTSSSYFLATSTLTENTSATFDYIGPKCAKTYVAYQNAWIPIADISVPYILDQVGALSIPIDLLTSNQHSITLDRASTTLVLTNEKRGTIYRFRLLQDSTGSRTVTWSIGSGTIKWSGGSAPTLSGANKTDWIELMCVDDSSGFSKFEEIGRSLNL